MSDPRRYFVYMKDMPDVHRAADRQRSGSALVVVLWVTGLLAMFVMAFAFDMEIQARITSSWRKKIKARQMARGGVALAHMALMETMDQDVKNPDRSVYLQKGADEALRNGVVALAAGSGMSLSREFGGGRLTVSVQPENARMNINSLIHPDDRELTFQLWEPILQRAGVPIEKRDALVDCLVDWVDANDLSHLNGAESSYYETLSPPYSAANGPLATIDELALIKGFDEIIADTGRTVFESVSSYLTTYSENEKININAASADTLVACFNISAQIAEDIVSGRLGPDNIEGTEDDKPYQDLNDLLSRVPVLDPSIGNYITFSASGRYRVRCTAEVGDIKHSIFCVLILADGNISILYWLEGEAEDSEPGVTL